MHPAEGAMLQKRNGTADDNSRLLLNDPLFFEVVYIEERCSLDAALLWVAIQQPPKIDYPQDFALAELPPYLCEALGIPDPPDSSHYSTPEIIRNQFRDMPAQKQWQKKLWREREEELLTEALRAQSEWGRWRELLNRATEPCQAELYLALHKGRLTAQGKLLPAGVGAAEFINNERTYGRGDPRLDDLSDQPIPSGFWTQAGIDWLSSAVTKSGECYCDIKVPVADLISVFPPPRSLVEGAVYHVGGLLVIDRADEDNSKRPKREVGRPPLFRAAVWDAFHVEVACLIKRGEFPNKKEAAIKIMTDWFERQHGKAPGRTTISEKLTGYYHALQDSPVSPDGNLDGN
jgi:hypothetical protein